MAVLRAASLLALVFAAPLLVTADCPGHWECNECPNSEWYRCTECAAGYKKDEAGEGICYHSDCHWSQEDEDDFGTKLMAGTIAGAIIATICVIVASLPVCCGVMKDSNLKLIGVVVGIVSGLCIAIPAITGAVSGGQAVDDFCDSCESGCTESDRDEATDAVAALGIIFAYTVAFGFVVVILAIVGLSLSCCLCCPCCGPLKADQLAKQQGGGPGPQVVGQPVGS